MDLIVLMLIGMAGIGALYFVSGFAVVLFSLMIFFQPKEEYNTVVSVDINLYAAGFFIAGLVSIGLSFMACVAALKRNRSLLLMIASFTVFVLVIEAILGMLIISVGQTLHYNILDEMKAYFRMSLENSEMFTIWSSLQFKLQCCGVNGPLDYSKLNYSLPCTCCKEVLPKTDSCDATPELQHRKVCFEEVLRIFSNYFYLIEVFTLSMAGMKIAGALYSFIVLIVVDTSEQRDRRQSTASQLIPPSQTSRRPITESKTKVLK